MSLAQSLAEECVDFALFFGINPHYLVGVAQLRSGLTDTNEGNLFGPFRLSQSDWDANRADQEFTPTLNFASNQITSWRRTCDVFALMTYRTQNALLAKLNRYPSAVELYSAQWPDAIPPTLDADLKAALDTTAPLIGPAAATLDDPEESGGVVPDQSKPIEPVRLPNAPTPSSFGTGAFKDKAPRVMRSLIADFQLSTIQAAGVLGNLGHESGGFRFFHELGQPLDKGGVGWAQWTGVRRKSFEKFCADQHLDPTSDQANYGYPKFELQNTPEKQVLPILRANKDIKSAVTTFVTKYERAGVVAIDSRVAFANIAFSSFNAQTKTV